jgi:SAM-dependent MidA family methyltransferase
VEQVTEENFSEFMREALYGDNGFYTSGGGAGRGRDFLTSPEVGDLFGRVLAHYIDAWYDRQETDEPGIIIDAGCGPGSLGASIARAGLENAQFLEYRLVDISPAHREEATRKLTAAHPEFTWSVHESLPECDGPTLVIANELLDNLVFDIRRTHEVYQEYSPDRKEVGEAYAFLGIFGDVDRLSGANVPRDLDDFRIPFHVGIGEWFDELSVATSNVASLSVLLFDYMKPVAEMQDENWLRMYANNKRVVGVDNVLRQLESGITGDITTDIVLEDLHLILDRSGFSRVSFSRQREWLMKNDIDIFSQAPEVSSSYDQLAAFAQGNSQPAQQSSFQREREVLLDENGLGGFGVFTAERMI